METLHSWLFTLVDVLLVGLGPCGFLRKPRGQGSLVWAPAWPGQVPRGATHGGQGARLPPFPGGWGPPCSALCAPPTAPWLVRCPRQLPFSQDVGPLQSRAERGE